MGMKTPLIGSPMRLHWPRGCRSPIRWFILILLGTIVSFPLFSWYLASNQVKPSSSALRHHNHAPSPRFTCPHEPLSVHASHQNGLYVQTSKNHFVHHSHHTKGKSRLDSKVLVFVETQYSPLGRSIIELLESSRFKYKAEISPKSLPLLTNLDRGKFSVVIFENYNKYLRMNKWNRELLDKYCREFNVGIIGFLRPTKEHRNGKKLHSKSIYAYTSHSPSDYTLSNKSPILRILRPGVVYPGPIKSQTSNNTDWIVFSYNDSNYQPIAQVNVNNLHRDHFDSNVYESTSLSNNSVAQVATIVVQDQGAIDGIQRVIFGANFGLDLWSDSLLLIDSISFLSHGKLALPLQRYVLIDIDDIFVGETGTRMIPRDVEALIEAQESFAQQIPGFKFNLGFSGKYYHKGNDEEDKGDDAIILNADKFWWFCHMWSHTQPHLWNASVLEREIRLNREFAHRHYIPFDSGYSIAPHHSGVYPVHEPLYEAWRDISDVKVTSTEEYPHLRPARLRRGFIHRNVMVLPRQTCGLYTHTIFMSRYPGGRSKLDNSIEGGELFYTIALNSINVFMTHLSNYGNDRLALYTFDSVFKFISCWTNLHLATLPPVPLASAYFTLHPEESDPVWVNPCLDARHKSIWASSKSCESLPQFLLLGPQKTGSTALYTFMSLHPALAASRPSPETFEEVQFFNGKNYYKGLDWYLNFFQSGPAVQFEKSATYFDGESVPLRVHSLLPNVKLIVTLISPARRAYSWYQHQRSHSDPTALNYSFYQVITSQDHNSSRPLRDLRHRCLSPGFYSQHLEHWLNYFSPSQILILDGEELKTDPVTTMNRVQDFISVDPVIDYSQKLRFDSKKGFFCSVTSDNTTKCLGKGKGRIYPPLGQREVKLLKEFYTPHNVALSKLLMKLRQPIPLWLQEDLS